MKVLHVLDTSVPNLTGYALRSRYIVETQHRFGIHPFVVTSDHHRASSAQEQMHGVTYDRSQVPNTGVIGFLKRLPILREVLLMWWLRRDILRIVRREAIDIIHAHSPVLCGLPAWFAARRLKRPMVYEVRALWEDAAVDQAKTTEGGLRYRLTRALETFVLKQADHVVVICDGLKEEILRRGIPADKIAVVPNGVDVEWFAPMDRQPRILERYGLNGQKVIGFIGSFFPFEGITTLLHAAALMKARNPHVTVMIVGSGQQEASLRQLAQDHGLSSTVIFTGRVNHEDVKSFYSIMDALVYPRLPKRITELVTPLKPLEAMAMGKVVVASDVGGMRELVQHRQTGLLFQAGNPQALAEACLLAISDTSLSSRLSRQARAYVERERTWELLCATYADLYERLVRPALSGLRCEALKKERAG